MIKMNLMKPIAKLVNLDLYIVIKSFINILRNVILVSHLRFGWVVNENNIYEQTLLRFICLIKQMHANEQTL